MKPAHLTYTSNPSQSEDTSHTLIYFIPGNPGLISYYTNFLSSLSASLSTPHASSNPINYHVYTQNHLGFSDSEYDSSPDSNFPYGLEDQILSTYRTIVSLRIPSAPRAGQVYDDVVLIGHSMGCYIALEVISRLHKPSAPSSHAVAALGNQEAENESEKPRIKAAILLFPTIFDIAVSPNGFKLKFLFYLPKIPQIVSLLAWTFSLLTPKAVMSWLLRTFGNLPEDAAEVTRGLWISRTSMWEMLYLVRDELELIKEDRWGEEVWGVEDDKHGKRPGLVFYFGQNDSWVANHIRDDLIAARGRTEQDKSRLKPIMVIEDSEVPHGFCFRHSEMVAEKVKGWIDDIMQSS